MQMKQLVIRTTSIVALVSVSAAGSFAQSSNTPVSNANTSVVANTNHAIGVQHVVHLDSMAPAPLPPRAITRGKAITLGIVIGGAVGATAGYLIGRDNCETCKDSMSAAVPTALGFVGGAALGAFVAAQNVPPGEPQMSHLPARKLGGLKLASFR